MMQTLEQLYQDFNQAEEALKNKISISNIQNCRKLLKFIVQKAVDELKITQKYTKIAMGKQKLLLSLNVCDEKVVSSVDRFLSEHSIVKKLAGMQQLKGLHIDLEV